jgi:hypothetical protein
MLRRASPIPSIRRLSMLKFLHEKDFCRCPLAFGLRGSSVCRERPSPSSPSPPRPSPGLRSLPLRSALLLRGRWIYVTCARRFSDGRGAQRHVTSIRMGVDESLPRLRSSCYIRAMGKFVLAICLLLTQIAVPASAFGTKANHPRPNHPKPNHPTNPYLKKHQHKYKAPKQYLKKQ